jgi:hypothetical protein
MATSGIDSVTSAAILTEMNGGTAFSVTLPLRCLFHSAMRTTDSTTDTEITTSSGYVAKAGSLYSGTGLTFAAASAGSPSTQNSNVAATVTNMPASTWAGNTITDSKATPRTTSADGVTTSASPNISSASGAFLSSDVGAIVTGTNIPTNTIIVSVTSGSSKTVNAGDTVTVPSGSWQTSLA